MNTKKWIKGAVWAFLLCTTIPVGCSTETEPETIEDERLGEVQQASCTGCSGTGFTCINGECINHLSNDNYCGLTPTSTISCAHYQDCVQGVCTEPWVGPGQACIAPIGNQTTTNCGPDYAGWCADPDGDGNYHCIDIENDEDHCGTTDSQCGEGEICEHGICALNVGMECDPDAGPDDYDGTNGRGAVHCYTGKAGDINDSFGPPGERPWNPNMLLSYKLDTLSQFACCDQGGGDFRCVDILDDENCGECGGADCTDGEGPNGSCAIDPANPTAAPFCACTWADLNVLAENGGDVDAAMQFEVCDTARADSCISNGAEGPNVGCACGTGPASRSTAATCSSGTLTGCTLNADCPHGQVCDTSGATGECKVVGCDADADCTGGGISADTPLNNVDPAGGLQGGMRCTSNPGSGLNVASVTSPPAGSDGICIDISSDPAYCTASPQGTAGAFISLGSAGTAVSPNEGFCGVAPGVAYRELNATVDQTVPFRVVPKTVGVY